MLHVPETKDCDFCNFSQVINCIFDNCSSTKIQNNAPMAQETFLLWLRSQLDSEGRGAQKRLAEHLGWEPSAMTRLLSGNRKVSLDDAQSIMEFFGKYPNASNLHYLKEALSLAPGDQVKEFNSLKKALDYGPDFSKIYEPLLIMGDVAAGLWSEVEFFNEEITERSIFVPILGYKDSAQFLLRVRGESMNKVAQNGELILCVDIHDGGILPQSGDLVVARRTRNDGQTVERTVKRLMIDEAGNQYLIPQSTDPRYQDPIVLDQPHDETAEVAVTAKVIGAFRLFT